MDKTIKLGNFDLPLSLDPATVIHSNKYSRADGAISVFVISTLHTEVVFKLDKTGEHLSKYIRNLDLPIYTGQEVVLIRVANMIVAYLDAKTNNYYYITTDLGKTLGIGIPNYLKWPIGIVGGALIYFLQQQTFSLWVTAPLISSLLFFWLQRLFLNSRIKKDIHHTLTES